MSFRLNDRRDRQLWCECFKVRANLRVLEDSDGSSPNSVSEAFPIVLDLPRSLRSDWGGFSRSDAPGHLVCGLVSRVKPQGSGPDSSLRFHMGFLKSGERTPKRMTSTLAQVEFPSLSLQ